jgi:hypothetical protein
MAPIRAAQRLLLPTDLISCKSSDDTQAGLSHIVQQTSISSDLLMSRRRFL